MLEVIRTDGIKLRMGPNHWLMLRFSGTEPLLRALLRSAGCRAGERGARLGPTVCGGRMKTLVIASGNAGKIREFQGLLQALPVSVQPQPEGLEVEETGNTFAANARLKAQAVAAATGEWALADDSGLKR